MLERLLGWLSALAVAWIVALTFFDVLGRYLFASPIRGSVEMIEYAMAMVIFSALPLVTRYRGHVSVSLIDGWFKGLGQRIKVMGCDVVSAFALGLLTWRLYLQGKSDLESGMATVVLGLPHAPLSFAMALLAGLTTLVVLGHIFQGFSRQGDLA
jgi:TRAP-type C4-dicarboxylate transport system permease small subunit